MKITALKYTLTVLVFSMLYGNLFSQCTTPTTGVTINVTPNTLDLFISNTIGTKIVEYGPVGFTPGTAGTPGANGTILTFPSGGGQYYSMSNLTAATDYHVYLRQNCGAGVFSPNSPTIVITTAIDCATAPVYNCGTLETVNFIAGMGAWRPCNLQDAGREKIYRFTPAVSGNHMLFLPTAMPGNSAIYYSYKTLSSGCTSANWTCIGSNYTYETQQYSFGPLTAGTTYLIQASPISETTNITGSFRIECPNCPQPTNVVATTVWSNSMALGWSGGNATLAEFGPSGFMPGSNNQPGVNGTVFFLNGGNEITGMQANTNYDIYLRSFCGSNYSPNSIKLSQYTFPCPPEFVYDTLGSQIVIQIGFNTGTGFYNPYISGCFFDAYGEEVILKFTPPGTGKYSIKVDKILSSPTNPYTDVSFGIRENNNTCNTANYQCIWPSPSGTFSNSYISGVLNAGVEHDLLIDAVDSFAYGSVYVEIKCGEVKDLVATNITQNSANVSFTCNCPNTVYMEYGPVGFTPGTGATAGGGILVSGITSPYSISGLTGYTNYNVFFRTSCGGFFSDNTVVTFKTLMDCANAPILNCGSTFMYQSNTTAGSWSAYNCGPTNNNSLEKVFKFTPTTSGVHTIDYYNFIAYTTQASLYYKVAGGTCDATGWICIGDITTFPSTTNWGPLTAGVTYLLLIDGFYQGGQSTKNFQINCPNVCSSPPMLYYSPITSTSAQVGVSCPSCTNMIIEWGLSGFTPGTGANAGAGGTVASITSSGYIINGLSPSTGYSVYARQNCGAPSGFSVNSTVMNFTTSASACNIAPSSITTPSGIYNICGGSSITLNRNGGLPGSGGTYQWYSGTCGGTPVGSGNSITVSPTVTTTYYVRAEAACGNSICVSRTVTVGGPVATITPASTTSFCTGGNVILNANTGTGLTYQWKKFGNIIVGATNSSYTATTAGTYKVTVTDAQGCSSSSANTLVTVFALPTAAITANGSTTICPGSSVQLSANTGAGFTYQWKKYSNIIVGATSSTYNATTAGKYFVIVTNANGCSRNSNKIIVTTLPSPPAIISANGPTTFCAGDSVVLSANSGSGLTYQWKKGGNNIVGATNINYSAKLTGNYKCTVSNSNGCTKNSNVIAVSVPCRTGGALIADSETDFEIYPNPSTGIFNIKFESESETPARLQITDSKGKLILEINSQSEIEQIDLSHQPAGVYLLKFETETGAEYRKLFKAD